MKAARLETLISTVFCHLNAHLLHRTSTPLNRSLSTHVSRVGRIVTFPPMARAEAGLRPSPASARLICTWSQRSVHSFSTNTGSLVPTIEKKEPIATAEGGLPAQRPPTLVSVTKSSPPAGSASSSSGLVSRAASTLHSTVPHQGGRPRAIRLIDLQRRTRRRWPPDRLQRPWKQKGRAR